MMYCSTVLYYDVRGLTYLSHQDAPEKRPDDISKVQQHHVFKKQSWQSKFGHKVPETLSLVLCDDVAPVGWNVRVNSRFPVYSGL